MLRWGALAATLTVVVAVGVNVLREGNLAVETPAQEKIVQKNKADFVEELEAPDEVVEAFERTPASLPEVSPARDPGSAEGARGRSRTPGATRVNRRSFGKRLPRRRVLAPRASP